MVMESCFKALHTDINMRLCPLEDRCQPPNSIRVPAKDLLYGVDAHLPAYSKPTSSQQGHKAPGEIQHVAIHPRRLYSGREKAGDERRVFSLNRRTAAKVENLKVFGNLSRLELLTYSS